VALLAWLAETIRLVETMAAKSVMTAPVGMP
jgi:hypothetical protein